MTLYNQMFAVINSDDSHAHIQFNPEHFIYKAHFPGNPITPGVCIIQMVAEILGQRQGCTLTLLKVNNMKFVAPLSPVNTPHATVTFDTVNSDDQTLHTKGSIQADGKTYTKFSLIFTIRQGQEKDIVS